MFVWIYSFTKQSNPGSSSGALFRIFSLFLTHLLLQWIGMISASGSLALHNKVNQFTTQAGGGNVWITGAINIAGASVTHSLVAISAFSCGRQRR